MSGKTVDEEKKRAVRPFPKHTLQEALKVADKTLPPNPNEIGF
jgi:hypothetical protein